MNKEHVKGAGDKAKGAAKEAVGKATNNDKLRTEGEIDKAKGAARGAMGDAKDAVRKGEERARRRPDG